MDIRPWFVQGLFFSPQPDTLMKDYDYIIAGGGCAGLSLAAKINRSSLKNRRILILDTEPKSRNDKTWCFWPESKTNEYTPYTGWQDLQVHTPRGSYRQNIAPLYYQLVSSGDFYSQVYRELKENSQIEFRFEKVLALEDLDRGAKVLTEERQYQGSYVFNSINFPIQQQKSRNIYLAQHFYGWFLEMENEVFDPEQMTLMDFRVLQGNEVCFVYILPFSKRKALVEFTVFSASVWDKDAYLGPLSSYMEEKFPGQAFDILQEEKGVIPMTNHQFERYKGKHIINIGTAGGFTKATTGYTFQRIQRDTQALVDAMIEKGKPYYSLKKKVRFQFYDNLLLYLIHTNGGDVHKIFDQLFAKNDFRTILRFLDEQTKLWEELYILGRLPWMPFLKAIKDYYIVRKPIENRSSCFLPQKLSEHESPIH